MIVRAILVAAAAAGSASYATGRAETITVPSGMQVTFHDMIANQPGAAGLTYRFRFIAPDIARDRGDVDLMQVLEDFDALCRDHALPMVAGSGPAPAQIIITLSDRPTEFGVPTPEATQIFEAYRIEGETCIWEEF